MAKHAHDMRESAAAERPGADAEVERHAHTHTHAPPNDFNTPFRIGILLNIAYVVLEAGFGLATGSLALIADAGHNLSDVLGLALAWGASLLAARPATVRRTFGMRRGTILAALLNGILLLVAVGGILWEALRRLISHGEGHGLDGETVIWVAGAGVVINGITALLFMSGRKHDLNIRGAFLHMAADALVSIGVVAAGLVIIWTGWGPIDPILSIIIAIVITWSTWGLLRESFNLALDAVPQSVNLPAVEAYLRGLPEVTDLHHLHIWGVSTTETALTVHLQKPDPSGDDRLLRQIGHELKERFGIDHITVQWERENLSCKEEEADEGVTGEPD